MSGAFVRKYTDQQRDAVIAARLDRRIPLRRVIELAEAGELVPGLEPFTMPTSTIASLARDEKKRRMGRTISELAQLEPRDAIEALRRRLVNAADAMLAAELKRPADKQDPERLRQIGRCVREFAAIPGPKDATKPAPGAKVDGTQHGGQTRGGLAGQLISAHRGTTAADGPTQTETPTENGDAARRSAQDAETNETGADERPRSLAHVNAARALVA